MAEAPGCWGQGTLIGAEAPHRDIANFFGCFARILYIMEKNIGEHLARSIYYSVISKYCTPGLYR